MLKLNFSGKNIREHYFYAYFYFGMVIYRLTIFTQYLTPYFTMKKYYCLVKYHTINIFAFFCSTKIILLTVTKNLNIFSKKNTV